MKYYFIDCETFSLRDNAVVLSVGLTYFEKNQNDVFKIDIFQDFLDRGLYFKLDKTEQYKLKRDVSQSTVEWWTNQDSSAKEVISNENSISCIDGINLIKDYLIKTNFDQTTDNIFSRGLIDLRWLDTLCEDLGVEKLFPYWCFRDTRTFLHVLTNSPIGNIETVDGFIKHNALHDSAIDCLRVASVLSLTNQVRIFNVDL